MRSARLQRAAAAVAAAAAAATIASARAPGRRRASDAPPGFGGFPQDFYPHHAALPGHPGTGRSGNGGDAGVPMGGGGSGDRKRGAPPRDRSSYGSGGKRPR